MAKHYKPNVAYELLIDGKYHYYGSHCRKAPYIYGSTIKANSGNRLVPLVNNKKISREEYNSRVKLVNVWEFDTPAEAWKKESELVDYGKRSFGPLCFNVMEGNNKKYSVPDEHKESMRKINKLSWERRFNEDPSIRQKFIEAGKKGLKNNPVLLKSRKVSQYDGDVFIASYPSLMEAERRTGIDNRNIARAANGKYHTAGGFRWIFGTP